MKYRMLKKEGDTIIEVMLAMALLTAFLFTSWGITNKATQIGINARKRVEMVNTMKEQAESIKVIYAQGGISQLIDKVNPTNDTTIDTQSCDGTDSVPQDNIFYYFSNSENQLERVQKQKKQQPDAGSTIWVQYKEGPPTGADPNSPPQFYDFYIRACWQTIGSVQNTDNAQFIVRLNSVSSAPQTQPEDPTAPPPLATGTTTLVYEDVVSSSIGFDRDYNDAVINMSVVEKYDTQGYLDEIIIDYDPVNYGATLGQSLWLDFDGIYTNSAQSATYRMAQNYRSTPMFEGNATIRYSNHSSGASNPSYTTVNKNQELRLFSSMATAVSNNRVTRVHITNIDKSESNKYSNRGEFNPKRYRTVLRVAPAPGGALGLVGWDIDLADVNPTMFDQCAGCAQPYPLAFFVPINFNYPAPGQVIDGLYCRFKDHASWLWQNRNANPIPYDSEAAQTREWYRYKVGNPSPYGC